MAGRGEPELVASGPFSLGPTAQARGRSFGAPTSTASFSHDDRDSFKPDAEGQDINALYGFNIDPMAPLAVPNKSTLEAWELEKQKKKDLKKEKKPKQSDEDRFGDAVKGMGSYTLLMPTSYSSSNHFIFGYVLVKVEGDVDGMEGVTSSSEGTSNGESNHMNIDDTEDTNIDLPFEDERLYFFQLPAILPRFKIPVEEPAVKAEGEDVEMKDQQQQQQQQQPSTIKMEKEQAARNAPKILDAEFDKAQEGRIGSLLVYKSGKVKLKLGSVLLEVAPGTDPSFLENVVVVDSKDQTRTSAVSVGNITEKFLCVPDIDSLLS